jgi:YebC/PmpR family DNA-binding regulatory protein
MSGHNKWSSIKHKKGAADARRGKIFSKIIKEITVAARMGGGDIDANPRLRTAINAAKTENMPKDNIERAIKKGTGELEGASYEEFVYEGYGPGGAAVMITALTDNKNRTVADVRHIFNKSGGSLGEAGCVSWMFDKKGVISILKSEAGEEAIMEAALEAGADDVKDAQDAWDVITEPSEFEQVRQAVEDAKIAIESAEITMLPHTLLALAGKEAEQMVRLLQALEDSDDVQNVYTNADIPDDALEAA